MARPTEKRIYARERVNVDPRTRGAQITVGPTAGRGDGRGDIVSVGRPGGGAFAAMSALSGTFNQMMGYLEREKARADAREERKLDREEQRAERLETARLNIAADTHGFDIAHSLQQEIDSGNITDPSGVDAFLSDRTRGLGDVDNPEAVERMGAHLNNARTQAISSLYAKQHTAAMDATKAQIQRALHDMYRSVQDQAEFVTRLNSAREAATAASIPEAEFNRTDLESRWTTALVLAAEDPGRGYALLDSVEDQGLFAYHPDGAARHEVVKAQFFEAVDKAEKYDAAQARELLSTTRKDNITTAQAEYAAATTEAEVAEVTQKLLDGKTANELDQAFGADVAAIRDMGQKRINEINGYIPPGAQAEHDRILLGIVEGTNPDPRESIPNNPLLTEPMKASLIQAWDRGEAQRKQGKATRATMGLSFLNGLTNEWSAHFSTDANLLDFGSNTFTAEGAYYVGVMMDRLNALPKFDSEEQRVIAEQNVLAQLKADMFSGRVSYAEHAKKHGEQVPMLKPTPAMPYEQLSEIPNGVQTLAKQYRKAEGSTWKYDLQGENAIPDAKVKLAVQNERLRFQAEAAAQAEQQQGTGVAGAVAAAGRALVGGRAESPEDMLKSLNFSEEAVSELKGLGGALYKVFAGWGRTVDYMADSVGTAWARQDIAEAEELKKKKENLK